MGRKAHQNSPRARRAAAANAGLDLVPVLHESPAFLVRLVQLNGFDEFHRYFAGSGLTPGRFSAFAVIAANPGVRPGALAEELRVKPSNVAALVNTLVGDGLVERRQDGTELRATKLFATPQGQRLFRELWTIHEDLTKSFLVPLTEPERRTFPRLLQEMAAV